MGSIPQLSEFKYTTQLLGSIGNYIAKNGESRLMKPLKGCLDKINPPISAIFKLPEGYTHGSYSENVVRYLHHHNSEIRAEFRNNVVFPILVTLFQGNTAAAKHNLDNLVEKTQFNDGFFMKLNPLKKRMVGEELQELEPLVTFLLCSAWIEYKALLGSSFGRDKYSGYWAFFQEAVKDLSLQTNREISLRPVPHRAPISKPQVHPEILKFLKGELFADEAKNLELLTVQAKSGAYYQNKALLDQNATQYANGVRGAANAFHINPMALDGWTKELFEANANIPHGSVLQRQIYENYSRAAMRLPELMMQMHLLYCWHKLTISPDRFQESKYIRNYNFWKVTLEVCQKAGFPVPNEMKLFPTIQEFAANYPEKFSTAKTKGKPENIPTSEEPLQTEKTREGFIPGAHTPDNINAIEKFIKGHYYGDEEKDVKLLNSEGMAAEYYSKTKFHGHDGEKHRELRDTVYKTVVNKYTLGKYKLFETKAELKAWMDDLCKAASIMKLEPHLRVSYSTLVEVTQKHPQAFLITCLSYCWFKMIISNEKFHEDKYASHYAFLQAAIATCDEAKFHVPTEFREIKKEVPVRPEVNRAPTAEDTVVANNTETTAKTVSRAAPSDSNFDLPPLSKMGSRFTPTGPQYISLLDVVNNIDDETHNIILNKIHTDPVFGREHINICNENGVEEMSAVRTISSAENRDNTTLAKQARTSDPFPWILTAANYCKYQVAKGHKVADNKERYATIEEGLGKIGFRIPDKYKIAATAPVPERIPSPSDTPTQESKEKAETVAPAPLQTPSQKMDAPLPGIRESAAPIPNASANLSIEQKVSLIQFIGDHQEMNKDITLALRSSSYDFSEEREHLERIIKTGSEQDIETAVKNDPLGWLLVCAKASKGKAEIMRPLEDKTDFYKYHGFSSQIKAILGNNNLKLDQKYDIPFLEVDSNEGRRGKVA